MSKSVHILGKKAIPVWLLVMALVATGAGAAVGTVLTGNVIAEMPVTISQALEVGKPVVIPTNTNIIEVETADNDALVDNIPQSIDALDGNPTDNKVAKGSVFAPDRSIGAVNDQQTAFQFAAEIDQHDWYAFALPLKNASNQDMVVELTMVFPDGITVEVMDGKGTIVDNVTRTGLNTWKFDLDSTADKSAPDMVHDGEQAEDSLVIVVAASDTIAPGFYTVRGQLLQISY